MLYLLLVMVRDVTANGSGKSELGFNTSGFIAPWVLSWDIVFMPNHRFDFLQG
jgi:hypothetical protein